MKKVKKVKLKTKPFNKPDVMRSVYEVVKIGKEDGDQFIGSVGEAPGQRKFDVIRLDCLRRGKRPSFSLHFTPDEALDVGILLIASFNHWKRNSKSYKKWKKENKKVLKKIRRRNE